MSMQRQNRDLLMKLNQQSLKGFCEHDSTSKTLLLGNSIIRDISEDMVCDTEVICHNGSRIQDIHKVVYDMDNITSYNKIILVTGCNACDSQTPPAEIVDNYKELICHMKRKMSPKERSVSSVIPCVNFD